MRTTCLGLLCLVSLLVLVPAGAACAQDEILLEDGRRFEGVIQWKTETHVALMTSFGLIEFKRSHVARVGEVSVAAMDRGDARSQGIINLTKRRPVRAAPAASPSASAAAEPQASPAPRAAPSTPTRVSVVRPVAWSALAAATTPHGDATLELPEWLAQRLGPFFPREPQTLLFLILLLFALVLFIIQVGCRFLDIESFSFPRGVILGALAVLLLAALYSVRGMFNSPLAWVLGGLASFLVLTAAVTAILQEHAGKATVLVGFVFFFGGVSISCIMVGAAGVVALW